MSTPAYEEPKPAADDVLVFIDDTGHETFAGNQGYYGLGGCLTTGFAYEHLKPKWRAVRKIINGDCEAPLHGSDITVNPKPESFAALKTFFEDRSFARIAVTTTKNVGLPVEMHPCVAVIGQLCREIETVASVLPCKRIWIFLESSERADPVVMRAFGQLTSMNALRPIPVEHCLMPKSGREPGLEVADFVISAASSEVQRRMRGKSGHAPDFNDVFARLPSEGARYREIERVTIHADGSVSIDGVRLAQAAQPDCVKPQTVTNTTRFKLRLVGATLWLILGVLVGWIENKIFHTNTGIGLTLGIILGGIIGYAINRPAPK